MTDAPALTTDLTDGILTVRLSRPEARNAQGPGLWAALAADTPIVPPAPGTLTT